MTQKAEEEEEALRVSSEGIACGNFPVAEAGAEIKTDTAVVKKAISCGVEVAAVVEA